MEFLAPRGSNACTGNKQWYVCDAGNFRGCCSSDPCTTGVCPDDESTTSSQTTSQSTSTSRSSDSSTSAAPSTTETAQTTSATSTVTSGVSLNSPTSISSVSATTTPTSGPRSGGTKPTNTGAMIGGILGAVAGLVVCVLLLWFCWWRKRRATASITSHRSASSRAETTLLPSRATTRRLTGSLPCPPFPTPSTTGSRADTTTSGVSSLSPGTQDLSTGLSQGPTLTSGISSVSPRSIPQMPPAPQIPPEFLAIPKETSFPELPDTGFYRQRAELASHSQSELINVPHNQRGHPSPRLQSCLRHKPGSRYLDPISSTAISSPRSPDSGKPPELTSRETARRVITADGVVLGANLDRYSVPIVLAPEPEEKGQLSKSDSEHVMSFMNYDRVRVEMTER